MKKLYFFLTNLLLAATTLTAQVAHLRIMPEQAKPGETVRFEYDIALSPLSKSTETIDVTALEYAGKTPEALDVLVQRMGNTLKGQFTLGKEAQVALLVFQAGERWDNNGGEGYFVRTLDAAGKPNPQSLAAQAVLYRDWGGMFELNRKTAVAYDLLSQAFAAKPALRQQYFSAYIGNLMAVKRGDAGKAEATVVLEEVEKSAKTLEEKDWIAMARLYERMSAPDKATAIRDNIRKTYPKGTMVRQERRQAMRNEPDLANHQKLVEAYLKDFPPTAAEQQDEINEVYATLGGKAAEKKNWEVLKSTAKKMRAGNRASLYNNIAWELAENGEALDMAREMAAEATEWAKNEISEPKETKKGYLNHKNWETERRQTFAQYADTYAYVLDKTNDPGTAAMIQAQVVEMTEGKMADMNERYTAYLERTNASDLRYRLEGFILHGQATGPMKEQFKRLYASEDKSAAGTEAYMAGLEKIARVNQKKEIAAKMMEQPAPGFSLKNLDGTEVSLESLKGKVVVIDFWATWCGPCKSSFPGMQQALNNFKDDPKVAFVFVDTWERVEDRAKVAGDYIKSKNYTFNVLLDLDDKVVASYGVSGIPTKYVVDRSGKIRFKSVGYAGSTDALVDELTAMIELAKELP